MKILLVVPQFNRLEWGATENLVWNLAKSLNAAGGMQCEIAAFRLEEESAMEQIQGICIHRFRGELKIFGRGFKHGSKTFAGLRTFLESQHFDLVHLWMSGRRAELLLQVTSELKIPAIMHCSEYHLLPSQKRTEWYLWKKTGRTGVGKTNVLPIAAWSAAALQNLRIMQKAQAVLCTNQALKSFLSGVLHEIPVRYFAPGVDFDYFCQPMQLDFRQFYQIPAIRPILLCIGHISEEGNQKFLLDMLEVLMKQRRRCHLVILGRMVSRSYLREIESRIRELNLAAFVTVIPGISPGDDRFRAAYQAASLVMLPSLVEAGGSAILEAWASGVPVLAAPTGNATDLIDDQESGQLMDPRNFTQWMTSVQELLDDRRRAQRERMRKNGLTRARSLNWHSRTVELIQIYQDVYKTYQSRQQGIKQAVQDEGKLVE